MSRSISCQARRSPSAGRYRSAGLVPLVAMADPWLIGICVAGLLALSRDDCRCVRRPGWLWSAISLFLAFKAAMLAAGACRGPDHQPGHAERRSRRDGARLSEWTVFGRSADIVRSVAISSSGVPPVAAPGADSRIGLATRGISRGLERSANFLAVHEFAFRSWRSTAATAFPCCGPTCAVLRAPAPQQGPKRRCDATSGRRRFRSGRSCAQAGSAGWTVRADSSAARVSRNSTFANGVPRPSAASR